MSTLNQHGLVKRFMDSTGYTNDTYNSGILKNGKQDHIFDYYEPEKMLKDFLKWMKSGAGRPKERDFDYRQIGAWIRSYQLPQFPTDEFTRHYNSKLTSSHALIIWQLKGCVSSTELAKAFKVDVKTVRDIWNSKSWANLTESYEGSL